MSRPWAWLTSAEVDALEWVDEQSRDTVGSSAERIFRPCNGCGARRLVYAPCNCHRLSR